MQTSMGLESLSQRGRSPFYNDLVKLYQETQDTLVEASNPSHGYITMTLKSLNFKERIKAIVRKYMNINLEKVLVTESSVINLMCLLEYTESSYKKLGALEATPGMMMENINRLYDDKQGKLEHPTKNLPFTFSFILYTSLWKIRNEDGSFYITAEEMAAGTLHEFGHIDHFIRASFRIYGRTVDAGEIVKYITTHPDRDLIMTLIERLKKDKDVTREFDKILSVTEEYFRTNNSLDDPYYLEALTTLVALIASKESAHQLFTFNNLLGGGRDRVNTSAYSVDAERSADEFAARNGAYKPLITMLGKFHATSEDKSHLAMRQFLWSGPAAVIGYCLYFTSVFRLQPEEVSSGYDPLIHRLALIVETAKHAFQDIDLPDEIKSDLRKQIQQSEEYIAQYKSAPHRLARAQIKKWKDDIGRFGRIFAAPFQNRLTQDYGRLQNATRSLSRHGLYYLADKT